MNPLKKIRSAVGMHWHNSKGWKTDRKIVVIESDDWGSIRMPSKEVYEKLLKAGIKVSDCPFNKYDSLASEDDLNAIYETLKKHKNSNGQYPIFTVNTIVANPDFEKISGSGFKSYYYEDFTETLKKYPKHFKSFDLWKRGIEEKFFHPQLHGREHLNVNRWLTNLQKGLKETVLTFSHKMYGVSTNITSEDRKTYMAAFDYDNDAELIEYEKIISDAQKIFKNLFGFTSNSFIATNYVWPPELEKYLFEQNVKYLQGSRNQTLPAAYQSNKKQIKHYLGEKNIYNQRYIIRNCFFEPTINPNRDSVSECLRQIKTAFNWKKPAIIGSHRLNYIGYLVEKNRTDSLIKLKELLSRILTIWPDVEFLSTDQLGQLIES